MLIIVLKLIVNKWLRWLKNLKKKLIKKYFRFKNYERKVKPPSTIHADFESVLVPEDSGKQNSHEPYTNKYQKHVAWSYGCKLVCVDEKI